MRSSCVSDIYGFRCDSRFVIDTVCVFPLRLHTCMFVDIHILHSPMPCLIDTILSQRLFMFHLTYISHILCFILCYERPFHHTCVLLLTVAVIFTWTVYPIPSLVIPVFICCAHVLSHMQSSEPWGTPSSVVSWIHLCVSVLRIYMR